uniref:Sialyltransferase-like protein n=1 Tax=Tetraselmis sp. GSL018 TaxID=582737 RepID=A0A061RZM3_9CHLO
MEPCIAGCEKESGVPCLNCPRGSACQCGTGNPMPVASAGYCRARDSFSCFLKCPPGFPCPSQLEAGAQANLHSGACSQALMELHANGTLQCEPTDEGM